MQHFCIITAQRTGSSMLVDLLNSHPELICYREVFLDQVEIPTEIHYIDFVSKNIKNKLKHRFFRKNNIYNHLDNLYKRTKKVTGFKLMINQIMQYPEVLDYLYKNKIKLICLKRNNLVERYFSLERAIRTGLWWTRNKKDVQPIKIKLKTENLIKKLNQLSLEDKEISRISEKSNAILITYEDLQLKASFDKQVSNIEAFLGVHNRKLHTIHQKITTSPLSENISNYTEFVETLKNSPYKKFLL